MRLWRLDGDEIAHVVGPNTDAWHLCVVDGHVASKDGNAHVIPVPDADGYYVECPSAKVDVNAVGTVLGCFLNAEGDAFSVTNELTARYEEIDLLYTISEVLSHTLGLEEAAEIIVREVSSVVGARRASIFVHDEDRDVLHPVAGWGLDIREFGAIPVDHSHSIAARVFRDNSAVAGDARDFPQRSQVPARQQAYRGSAFLSAPIPHRNAQGIFRPVGVINLTDRLGADAFSSSHRKLIVAIAGQIGAAIENARLVALDRQRQRVRRELELAHDLQLRLLPSPGALGAGVDAGARCVPSELVGGDFYQFVPLAGSRLGVMLGDVSTHGFPAALIMALVLSAAGIHAAATDAPEEAVARLFHSVAAELETTEMFLSLIYVVVERNARRLRYTNAGHPHGFLVRSDGSAIRLGAVVPPLGLSDTEGLTGQEVPLSEGGDLLVLFSDGITDVRDDRGRPFGEARVLEIVRTKRDQPTQAIVDAVFDEVNEAASFPADDQTLLILRV